VFTLVTKLTRGRTIGKALVNIRLIDCKDTVLNINKVPHIKMYKLFIRYFIIYAISVPSLLYAYNFSSNIIFNLLNWDYPVCLLCHFYA
jgi:hypothetical protein